MSSVKVAICQVFCLAGDREGNFVRIENALQQAVELGGRVVCFPETCILGWVFAESHDRAHPIPGGDSDRLCELARRYKVYLSIGLCEKQGQDLYDSAIFVDPSGNIILKHRKINLLGWLMDRPYTSGDKVAVADTEYGKVGMLICADTFLEDILEELRSKEPGLVLVPYGWAEEEEKWPEHGKELAKVVISAAGKTGAAVVGVNCVGRIASGPWAGRVFGGQSLAVDRDGRILATCRDRDSEVKVVEIQL